MQTDIRLPIGLIFSIIGAVITIYGFATRGSEIYKHSLNINVNIYTGIGLVIFGAFMLWMAMRGRSKEKTKPQ